MLRKATHPHLNRAQRRHPNKMYGTSINKGWLGGGSWLLAGLMIRGGFTARVSADGAQV